MIALIITDLQRLSIICNPSIIHKGIIHYNFTRIYSNYEKEMCVKLFNPMSKPAYHYIINNWMNAMIDLLEYVKTN